METPDKTPLVTYLPIPQTELGITHQRVLVIEAAAPGAPAYFAQTLRQLTSDKPVIVACEGGVKRSKKLAFKLSLEGFKLTEWNDESMLITGSSMIDLLPKISMTEESVIILITTSDSRYLRYIPRYLDSLPETDPGKDIIILFAADESEIDRITSEL